jgi:hypothetical protein
MEPKEHRKTPITRPISLYLKYGVILALLIISVAVEACSSTSSTASPDTATTNLGAPPVTVTIQFNNGLTALPTQPPYVCGAWITDTTPAFIPGNTIPVYAYFKHLINGNPQGVGGATAQATLYLANGNVTSLPATTTGPDGLAVFSFKLPNDPNIANRNNLVTVNFTSADGTACTVDQNQAAFFTPLIVTQTPTSNNKKN